MQNIETWQIVVGAILWALSGMYGAYESTWTTRTHADRWSYIKKYHTDRSKWLSLMLCGAVLGLLLFVMARVHMIQWQIRQRQLADGNVIK